MKLYHSLLEPKLVFMVRDQCYYFKTSSRGNITIAGHK